MDISGDLDVVLHLKLIYLLRRCEADDERRARLQSLPWNSICRAADRKSEVTVTLISFDSIRNYKVGP